MYRLENGFPRLPCRDAESAVIRVGEIVDSAVSGAVRVVVGKLATAAGLTAINRMITAAGCDLPFRPGSN